MANRSYSYSYSSYESIIRMVNIRLETIHTSLFGEVIENPAEMVGLIAPGEVILKILNLGSSESTTGAAIKLEFPNLISVPVINHIQNITLPKVSVGQRGLVIFNKHALPQDEDTEFDIINPDPHTIFSINDGLFAPMNWQLMPSEDTTTITSPKIDLSTQELRVGVADQINMLTEKVSILNAQNEDLIQLIARLFEIIGEVPQGMAGNPLINTAPMFPETLLNIATFINE